MLMCQDIKDGGIFLCRVGVSVVMVVVVLVMLECCGRVVHVETIAKVVIAAVLSLAAAMVTLAHFVLFVRTVLPEFEAVVEFV